VKFHIFWFGEYYPNGGLSDYAGSVDAGSIDDARAFLFAQFRRSDNEVERYQISDEDLIVLETGRLQHQGWLLGNKRNTPTIHPDESVFGMSFRNKFSDL
jgi:hypothetical protein